MTAQDYLDQNAKGFEGDSYLKAEFERLIAKNDIKTIIETGSYLGATTRQFCQMVDNVITIEINKEYHEIAKARGVTGNSRQAHYDFGNSVDLLPRIIPQARHYGNILFFLDAHWNDYNPLLDELAIIADEELRPCIAIHDFKVPDHPELGYDSYAGQDYEWSWIEESINNIYGKDGYTYHYNSQAEGAMRGVIFIEPK